MANNLREIRKNKKLTQETLGEKIGVSRTQITKWELGLQAPNLPWLEKLAKALNVTPAELIADGTVKATPAAASSQSVNILMETWLACTDVAKALRLKKKIPKSQDATPLIVSATKYFFDKFAEGNPPDADEIEKFMLSITR